jgi:hypothetical protein
MGPSKQNNSYLLLDSKYNPLARGQLVSPPTAANLQVRVLDNKLDAVTAHETIQLVNLSDEGGDFLGRIIQVRNDCVILEQIRMLGNEVRLNFRMPVRFSSVIYPLTGKWKGKREITAKDLSCSGISFYSQEPLADKEQLEVVIPTTELPLVLKCEILRHRPADQGPALYASKFIDTCHDEEVLVRKTVFNIQLQDRARAGASMNHSNIS